MFQQLPYQDQERIGEHTNILLDATECLYLLFQPVNVLLGEDSYKLFYKEWITNSLCSGKDCMNSANGAGSM